MMGESGEYHCVDFAALFENTRVDFQRSPPDTIAMLAVQDTTLSFGDV